MSKLLNSSVHSALVGEAHWVVGERSLPSAGALSWRFRVHIENGNTAMQVSSALACAIRCGAARGAYAFTMVVYVCLNDTLRLGASARCVAVALDDAVFGGSLSRKLRLGLRASCLMAASRACVCGGGRGGGV